ncbi:MAG TPA: alpha/beta hydrolase-fold protein, partial [Blastocatellia bacterium]|nr:alpha/beta hydrolase-fold protein [Blastocatellia bacterium]
MNRLFLLAALLCVLSLTVFGQKLQTLSLNSKVLGEERIILVRTPDGYERDGQRYPVLYLTDGDRQLSHTISTVEFLARNGRIPEMIVVGITNTDRTRDLTPTNGTLRNPGGQPQRFPTAGGADKFLKFIETELIPSIESDYRTQPYRVFAGHSFGGLFALHTLMTHPEVFNAYIAVSPTIPWDDGLPLREAEAFCKDRKDVNRTLFFTVGSEGEEMVGGFDRLKKLLAKQAPKRFTWDAMLMEDEDHGSIVLRSHYFALRKIFDGWRVPDAVAAGGLTSVEEHYKKLTAKFGYAVLPPEALMNQLGYQLFAAGKRDEAITAFKSNVERYPNSANVYDSLGEAYEKSGKLNLAKPNYEKAVEL